jgi:hypothetical protein
LYIIYVVCNYLRRILLNGGEPRSFLTFKLSSRLPSTGVCCGTVLLPHGLEVKSEWNFISTTPCTFTVRTEADFLFKLHKNTRKFEGSLIVWYNARTTDVNCDGCAQIVSELDLTVVGSRHQWTKNINVYFKALGWG